MKNQPQRTCIGCKEKKNKVELIRIVKNKQEEVFVDKTGKAQVIGAYICNSVNCLEKAIKNKKLLRSLGLNISQDIYERLRGVIVVK